MKIDYVQSPLCLESGKGHLTATTPVEATETIFRQDLALHRALGLSAMSLTHWASVMSLAIPLCPAQVNIFYKKNMCHCCLYV